MQQPGGGSQFGVPPSEVTPFLSPAGAVPRPHQLTIDPLQQQATPAPPLAEAASPINSRPPPPSSSGFDELAPAVGAGNFPVDDEALAAAAGEEAERGGAAGGNRWPRQETLALLKIRSDMDATFRDATLKGPLWEDVSRKLAELGYKRSAKKCKEKFENVHKYYKRTKDGRAGRQDGKSYRFFSQLEALHSGGAAAAAVSAPVPISFSPPPVAGAGPSAGRMQPMPISSVAPPPITTAAPMSQHGISGSAATVAAVVGLSFSSNSSSSSSDSDDEGTEDAGGSRDEGAGRKRKRESGGGGGGGSGSGRKMMAFFEGLMKQVMERQEAMQQRFLETIEKREQDRMIREEAWRRQEVVRLNHEKELLAQERSMAANRDNALISYLQKITGQTIPIPTAPAVGNISVVTTLAPQTPHVPPPPLQAQQRPQPPPHQQQALQKPPPITVQPLQQHPPAPPPPHGQPQQQTHDAQPNHQSTDIVRHQPSATELIGGAESQDAGGMVSFEPMSPSSRWPKAEVHALIKLRSGLDSRYQEAGPKGPLWEEISAGMQGLGYSRSAKRCKEKWENINKYFKKVKESNKKRPEDAKTCPYFHQLDALYRKKHLNNNGGASSGTNAVGLPRQQEQEPNPTTNQQEQEHAPQQTQQPPPAPEREKNGNHGGAGSGSNSKTNGETGGPQAPNSNGGLPSSYFEEGMKKPEDIVKELMEPRHPQNMMGDYDKLDAAADSDNMDQDDDCEDDDEDDDDEARKMQYKIQFQRPNVNGGSGGMAMVK